MVPSGWLLLSQYELSSPRPEESSFICCFQEPSPDKDITWGLRTTGFIPDLFRLSVTFYNFIHFLKKQTVYTFVLGTQFLGHSPCSSGDIFFSFSVAPHRLHIKVFICKDRNKKHTEGTDAQSMKPIFILSDSQIFFKYV